jgi:SAM-dependent methyltransferase
VKYSSLRQRVPRFLDRYLWHFENTIEDTVKLFGSKLPQRARVLDAGAGECQYAGHFQHTRYTAVDLAVGDHTWDYTRLHALCDLTSLPFPDDVFDAAINIVTLEHVRQPQAVIRELCRTLKPGGKLLLVVPQDWEVHQSPHDYFRYTRHGVSYLLESAGFANVEVQPGGGYFRLMGRRMLNGIQFFRGIWMVPAALVLAPAGLLFPLLDRLDRERNFTLGYLCSATKP